MSTQPSETAFRSWLGEGAGIAVQSGGIPYGHLYAAFRAGADWADAAAGNPQAQADAVMNVLAPHVDGPPGSGPQRWPVFRLDYDGQMVVPSDGQVRALAEAIVTAIRTATGGTS